MYIETLGLQLRWHCRTGRHDHFFYGIGKSEKNKNNIRLDSTKINFGRIIDIHVKGRTAMLLDDINRIAYDILTQDAIKEKHHSLDH